MRRKERLTAHLPAELHQELEKHRIPGGLKAEPAERLLRRLLAENPEPLALELPASLGSCDRQISFRVSEPVWDLIDQYSTKNDISTHAAVLALLHYAVRLPVLPPMDIEAFYRYLWDKWGQGDRLLMLFDVFEDPEIWPKLPKRQICRFLEKLHEQKRIRLVIPLQQEDIDKRFKKVPSLSIRGQKHRCDRLELKPNLKCSRINESDFRRRIYFTPSWSAAKKIAEESGRKVACISQARSVERSQELLRHIFKEWVLLASMKEDSAIAMSPDQATNILGWDIRKAPEYNLRTIPWRRWIQKFGLIIDDLHDGEIHACRLILRDEKRTEIALISIQALDQWSRRLAAG